MKAIIFAALLAFVCSTVPLDPYQQMTEIPNCVKTMNTASTHCQMIWPKSDHYFERYYACFQEAGKDLTFKCSSLFCQAENLDTFDVDCNSKYSFTDSVYNYTQAHSDVVLSVDCKKALVPAVDACNKQFTNYTISNYYSKYFDCVASQSSMKAVPKCAFNYCKYEGLDKYVQCDSTIQFDSFVAQTNMSSECVQRLNQTSQICNQIPNDIENYYQYYYQCYQQHVQDKECAERLCQLYDLGKMGVDCSQTYNLPKPTPNPQPQEGNRTCFTQNLPGCYDAVSEAVKYCNKTTATNQEDYYTQYYACIQNYKPVKQIPECALCYCEQVKLYELTPACPQPSSIVNFVEKKTEVIDANCAKAINYSSVACNKINPMIVNYYSYYYECFQKNIQNYTCSEQFCGEYHLDNFGVDCKQVYNLPKPQVMPQNKSNPTCDSSKIAGCPKAIDDAVKYCNESISVNHDNYYETFFECVSTYKEVRPIAGCSQCYCQQIELYNYLPNTCPAPKKN